MSQEQVINNTNGIYLVDAGAGTGKTYTITRRYANLLKKGISPNDMLLVTFTRNATEKMKEDIINECQSIVPAADLINASIYTFHSLCSKIINRYGYTSPKYFGIDTSIANAKVIENETLESELFKKFFHFFRKDNIGKYESVLKVILDDYPIVLSIIKKLCSRGIFPKKEGWYMNGKEMLEGDLTKYKQHFDNLNEPQQGTRKMLKSELLKKFKAKTDKNLYASIPDDLLEELNIKEEAANLAFQENRDELLNFLHDIYCGVAA